MVAANFRLPLERVVLLVCQIYEHYSLQIKISNKFGFSLGPTKCVSYEKNNKIWLVMPWTENDLLITFLSNLL